jgi:hypothetical protein
MSSLLVGLSFCQLGGQVLPFLCHNSTRSLSVGRPSISENRNRIEIRSSMSIRISKFNLIPFGNCDYFVFVHICLEDFFVPYFFICACVIICVQYIEYSGTVPILHSAVGIFYVLLLYSIRYTVYNKQPPHYVNKLCTESSGATTAVELFSVFHSSTCCVHGTTVRTRVQCTLSVLRNQRTRQYCTTQYIIIVQYNTTTT